MSEPPLSDDDRATLVAYLDGELDEDACARSRRASARTRRCAPRSSR